MVTIYAKIFQNPVNHNKVTPETSNILLFSDLSPMWLWPLRWEQDSCMWHKMASICVKVDQNPLQHVEVTAQTLLYMACANYTELIISELN